jgi:hypothetical protein
MTALSRRPSHRSFPADRDSAMKASSNSIHERWKQQPADKDDRQDLLPTSTVQSDCRTPPLLVRRLTIYERSKQQLSEKERKMESLRKALVGDFTPTTISSSASRRAQSAPRDVSTTTGDSTLDRLCRTDQTTSPMAAGKYQSSSRLYPSRAASQGRRHRTDTSPYNSSPECPSRTESYISQRLENLYEEGVGKLLQRPKNDRQERELRDRRYEEKQMQESWATFDLPFHYKTPPRWARQPPPTTLTPVPNKSKNQTPKSGERRLGDDSKQDATTIRPPPPSNSYRGRFYFPSEIVVSLDDPETPSPLTVKPDRKQPELPAVRRRRTRKPWDSPIPLRDQGEKEEPETRPDDTDDISVGHLSLSLDALSFAVDSPLRNPFTEEWRHVSGVGSFLDFDAMTASGKTAASCKTEYGSI